MRIVEIVAKKIQLSFADNFGSIFVFNITNDVCAIVNWKSLNFNLQWEIWLNIKDLANFRINKDQFHHWK